MVTNTDRNMVPYSAVSVNTTEAGTRVLAFPVYTSLVCWAVSVNLAFWAAVRRTADHLGEAGTLAPVTYLSGRMAVRSARVWFTGVSLDRLS